jgi:O-antigen/teichoic acid export membrane protein
LKAKSARKIVGNTVWRFLQLGVAGSVELVTFFVLARWIGPERYGLFTLSLSILALLLLFANFGFGSSITRYIAHYLITSRDRVRGVVQSGLLLGTGAGLLVGVACIIVAPYVARWYSMSELGVLLRMGALFIFLEAGRGVLEAVFRGFQDFRTPAVVSLVSRPLQMILVLEAVRYGLGVEGAVAGVVLGRLIAYLLLLGGLRSVRSFRTPEAQGRPVFVPALKEVTSYALPVALYAFVFYLYTDVDLLILGYFTSSEQVGHYHFAKLFFRVPVLILSAYALVISPVVTGFFAQGDAKRLQSAFEASETVTLAFVVPTAALLFIAARPFIQGFFPEYAVCVLLS